MTDFSYSQLEGLWEDAGGSKLAAPVAAAIAMAESGGRSDVTSSNPDGGTNVGPWQLDTNGVGSGYTVAQLQDPSTNARLAVHGSDDGKNWSDWATFASGAYKKFLKGNVPPTQPNPGGNPTTTAAGGSQDGLAEWSQWIPGFGIPLQFLFGSAATIADVAQGVQETEKVVNEFAHYVSWLFYPAHWLRVVCFLLGVPLVGMGLVTLTIGTKPIPVSAYGVSTEVSSGGIAPAMGIAEVTVGAVLLFFAFHNLDAAGVNSPAGMLRYIKQKAGGTTGGGEAIPT